MKLFIFDTETTGLPPKNTPTTTTFLGAWPYIVQLSYILYDTESQTVLTLTDTIVKCAVPIPHESSLIHGITDTIAQQEGSTLDVVIPLFLQTVEQADLIVAHNIAFDKDMLVVECQRLGIALDIFHSKPLHCTMKSNINRCQLARHNKMGNLYFKFPTLAELHHHLFQIWPKGMHNAKADVLICLRCYLLLDNNYDIARTQPELYAPYLSAPYL